MSKRSASETNRPKVAPTVLYRPARVESAAPAAAPAPSATPTHVRPVVAPVESVTPEPPAEEPAAAVPARAEASADRIPFHAYLAKAREARGMSLDDLAHQTKIRRAILEAVENDERRELPEKVFVLGYVRSYALAVGLPVEEAARRFNQAWTDDSVDAELAEVIKPRRSWAWVPLMASGLILAAVIWFVVQL